MAAIHGRFTRSQILIQNGEWLLPPALGYPSLFLCVLAPASRTSLRVCSEGLGALQLSLRFTSVLLGLLPAALRCSGVAGSVCALKGSKMQTRGPKFQPGQSCCSQRTFPLPRPASKTIFLYEGCGLGRHLRGSAGYLRG